MSPGRNKPRPIDVVFCFKTAIMHHLLNVFLLYLASRLEKSHFLVHLSINSLDDLKKDELYERGNNGRTLRPYR